MSTTKFYGYTTTSANEKPIARLAFTEVTAVLGSIIQLDGRKSSDPEGNPLEYKWSFTQVPLGSGITKANINPLREDYSAVSFTPDKTGVYVIQLIVNDGELDSDPISATIGVQLSQVPCGEGLIPDMQFLWSYLSDFWNLVEDREYLASAWSAAVQVVGSEIITLWSNDYNKSLATIQNTVQRRWQRYKLETDLSEERQTVVATNARTGKSSGVGGTAGKIGEVPGTGNTAVFHVEYGDPSQGYADFERMNTHYGAEGRIIVVNDEGHTVSRVYRKIDPDTSVERSVAVLDRASLVDGIVGARWRVPHLLFLPNLDVEELGASTGDVLVLEVTRRDTGITAELRCQIVGVDRTRIGFEFSLLDLEAGETSTDTDLFEQLVQDLRIIPADSDDATITAAARTIMSFLPVGINLATRPFSPFRLTFAAKKVIHNKRVRVEDDVTGAPALQQELYEPSVVLRENLDYIVGDGYITFVDGLFTPQSMAPEELWAECVFVDNTEAIEGNFGRLVDLKKDDLTQKQTRVPYLSAVKGLFYAATNGPDIANIRLGLQILLGLPYAEARGKIIELEEYYSQDVNGNDLGRFLIEDVDSRGKVTGFRRLYFYPTVVGIETNKTTGEAYKIGDIVQKWAPLSRGVEVQDWEKTPDLWRRSLGGLEILKYFTLKIFINGDVFDSNDVEFAFDFVNRIKPAYTRVISTAFKSFIDDIEIDDIVGGSMSLGFYDNGGWPLETAIRADDDNQQGYTLWNFGSRPFMTRTLALLRDVITVKNGTDIQATSATGWDVTHVRARIDADDPYTNAPVREGDMLVIFRGQPGATMYTNVLYEIGEVVDANTITLLQEGQPSDPTTYGITALDANAFVTGGPLVCCIVRRESNPIIKGSDLVTDGTDEVTSASALFLTNGAGPDDHLIIESGPNAGEYRIDVISTSPLNISETEVKLVNLDGSAVTLGAGTDQDFRVIRYLMMDSVISGARVLYTGSAVEIEVLDTGNSDKPKDVFTPGLVGSTINVAGSENPVNDGDFVVSAYIHPGRIRITSASTTSDTNFQATVRLNAVWVPGLTALNTLVGSPPGSATIYYGNIWHPGFETIDNLAPSEAVECELISV